MSLQDDIVQRIVADIMDTPKLGEAWSSIDINSRYVIMMGWREMVRAELERAFEEAVSES